jgi:lysophospholipid acyltransferase (LPLAT)-like uncharacterized protein
MAIEGAASRDAASTTTRGRLVRADVPHAPDPTRWLDPLLFGSNAAVFGATVAVHRTARITFREPFVPPETEGDDRPLIYVTWHRMNYACTPVFLALPAERRPTLIMHDGLASRAFSHRSAVWGGFECFAFRRRSKVPAREQIAAYVRSTRRPILNLPDSGGPYGVMKPGILEVAKACDARLVPFQVEASPALSLGKTLRHVLPLPFCHLEVRRGPALDPDSSVETCQHALDALA